MLNRLFSKAPLEPVLLLASLVLGLLHASLGRYAMNRDGMSYLDVGDSFFRHDWANAVNAYWSPLYPWTVGLVLGAAKPPPRWEFPLVHLVNFGVFVVALFAFRFLLHALLAFASERMSDKPPADANPHASAPLPEWALVTLAYAIFLWTALEVERMFEVTPDLAVLACVCLTAGMLLRLRQGGTLWKFALFGLILALGYWTKAILFPLGFVTLAAGYLWKRSRPGWGHGMALAAVVFLCASAPLIFLLSHQKGRFTFGDSGKLNYAWFVSPRTYWRNWQGEREVPGSGHPVHPTRQLLRHPPLFEFDGPLVATYPPWADPSYWNEGLQGHFKLKPQLEVLASTAPAEARLLFRARPELVAGVIILALLSGQLWLARLRELWPLIALSIAGLGIYLPLLEHDRHLGGFVLVLFLTLIAAVRLRPEVQKGGACVAVAVFLVMALGTADYTLRVLTNHLAIAGSGPNSTWQDLVAAKELGRMGAVPGDKVAVIGDGASAYWAHLGKLRIVAEIMDTNMDTSRDKNQGSKQFWDAPEAVRQNVYNLLAQANAKLVVTSCPPCPLAALGWKSIAGTPYCVRLLP
ncbi:MAG: hypothetical protein ABSA80_14075 [Terriglobales bacterium]|jgi:hypothetical protein